MASDFLIKVSKNWVKAFCRRNHIDFWVLMKPISTGKIPEEKSDIENQGE